MHKFKIGDRVCCIQSYQGGIFPGDCGVVMCYDGIGRAGVNVDGYREERHSLKGRVEDGHGWYVPESLLELEKIDVDFGELPVLDITNLL